jgi:hypothetical protein
MFNKFNELSVTLCAVYALLRHEFGVARGARAEGVDDDLGGTG